MDIATKADEFATQTRNRGFSSEVMEKGRECRETTARPMLGCAEEGGGRPEATIIKLGHKK